MKLSPNSPNTLAVLAMIRAARRGVVATRCAAVGIPLIHLPTDYVFDGTGYLLYLVEDEPPPVNAYAARKLGVEAAVRSLQEPSFRGLNASG